MKLQIQLELQRISLGLYNALLATGVCPIGAPQNEYGTPSVTHQQLHTSSYIIWRYF